MEMSDENFLDCMRRPIAASLASAQWLNYPTAGIPRTANGKANLSAPAAEEGQRPAGPLRDLAGSGAQVSDQYRRGLEARRRSLPALGGGRV